MRYGIAHDLQCIELILIIKCLAIANQKCLIMHAEHIHMCHNIAIYREEYSLG